MIEADERGWKPTDRVTRGIVVKSYLPLKRHPELRTHDDHFFNLYVGDEVYVFEESKDRKWFRGYLCWTPLPEAYVSGMVSVDDQFPHLRNRLVVIPRKFVHLNLNRHVVENPFVRLPAPADFHSVISESCTSPSLYDSLAMGEDSNETQAVTTSKPPRPSFPYYRYEDRPFAEELAPILGLLSSHIYGVYSSGDFALFQKLTNAFYELDAIRSRLQFSLLTSYELIKVRRLASALLASIGKLIASKHKSFAGATSFNQVTEDPSGAEGIFGRNVETGELLSYEEDNLQSLVLNSMLHGLLKDFPAASCNLLRSKPSANDLFEPTESHILVDVNDVKSDASIGNPMLNNISASMYLCSKNERLTEPFTVNMDSDQISSLNSISAALFKNIPAGQIKRCNTYLAVVLTEKVPVTVGSIQSEYTSPPDSPFQPFEKTKEGRISSIRRGIAAGAVDITRVFARYNESNTDLSQAFKFKVHLFGSYLSKTASMQSKSGADIWDNESVGWGELIDRILTNSHKGVAINPRATSLEVNIKEIRSSDAGNSVQTSVGAIKSVPTYFYDILSGSSERIYLSLGKVSLLGNLQTNVESITIKLSCSNDRIRFSSSANENLQNTWKMVSVRPGESIGDTIRINGLKHMRENETINVAAYLNGFLMGKLTFYIRKGGQIMSFKKYTNVQLLNSVKEPLVNLELATEYVGKKYNLDSVLKEFLELPYTDSSAWDAMSTKHCIGILIGLTKVSVDQLQKFFRELLLTYLHCFDIFENKHPDRFSDEIRRQLFVTFVDSIDKLMARSDRLRRSFNVFYEESSRSLKELPHVGSIILQHMSDLFGNCSKEWGKVGSAVSRTSLYLIMISVISSKGSPDEWRLSFQLFFSQVCQFLASTSEPVAKDQILVLQTYDMWLGAINRLYDSEMLVQFSLGLLQSCRNKEENREYATKGLSPMDARYLNTKLSLLRRILAHKDLHDYLFDFGESKMVRLAFLSKCIDWALLPYTYTPLHISSIRLGNGVLISLIENAKDRKLRRNLIRLLPTLCRAFILTRKYCKENNLFKPKITFTELFPRSIPCSIYPMDSLIRSEVLVEVLVELITIICELTKAGEAIYGARDISFVDILSECEGDKEFHTDFCLKQITNNHVTTLYHMVKIVARGQFFPANKWLGVSAMFNRSFMTLVRMYRDYMIQQNLPNGSGELDIKLWTAYLKAIFTLANNKLTYLIKLGIIARKGVYRIMGNVKERAADLLNSSWDALACQKYEVDCGTRFGIEKIGPYQMQILEDNVGLMQEIFLFAFHRHIECIKVSCRLLWCSAITCWSTYGNLQPLLNIAIPELYNAYQTGRLYLTDYDLQRFKICTLYTVHIARDDPIYQLVLALMEELFAFLHTVANAYKISDQEEFDDDRTAVHMEMFTYLLNADRPELFHKMIYDLFIHFLRKKDHVQAALSLELLANTYDWNTNNALASISYPPLPEQSSFERKEYLYKESAKNFAKGLKLEKALSIYKDLIAVYDQINYDLSGLAYVYGEMSSIYTSLQTVDRLVPTYFKVSFTGLGFPSSLRNKRFIFEGLPFEHITSMHDRLLRVYHGTTIVQSQERMDELFINSSVGRFIHVSSVEPQFELSEHFQRNADKNHFLNNKTWMYIENRNLRTFSNSRRLPGATGVTDLWVNEMTYRTTSTFPTLMNRSEIIEVTQRKLSPLQNALRSLRIKVQELNGLENMCWKVIKEHGDRSEIFGELSRNMTGTIDAPVNGGITQYREFLNPDMASDFEDGDLQTLTAAFADLATILARCLILHRELLPSEKLKESHNMLIVLFKKNFELEIIENNINLEGVNSSAPIRFGSFLHGNPMHSSRNQLQLTLQQSFNRLNETQAASVDSRESSHSRTDTMDTTPAKASPSRHGLFPTESGTSIGTRATSKNSFKFTLSGITSRSNNQ